MLEQKQARLGPLEPITFVLIATLVITPWFFGGVWSSVQSVLLFVAAGLLVLDALRGAPRSCLPTAFWPLVLGIALGLFQLVPLGPKFAPKLAPGATQWRSDAAYTILPSDDQAKAAESPSSRSAFSASGTSRSLYPPATREHLALLILVTCVFWIAARCFPPGYALHWLLLAGTVCGVALALFGLIQKFTWNGQIYWSVPLSQGGRPFGPYVNRNNAGGFLNLCLATSLGPYVWHNWRGLVSGAAPSRTSHNSTGDDKRRGKIAKPNGRHKRQISVTVEDGLAAAMRGFLAEINGTRIMVMAGVVFIAGGVVATASRGSILSLGFAMAITFAVMLSQKGRRSQGIGLVIAAGAALALVVWLGQFSEVRERFDQMMGADSAPDTRLLNWADALHALPSFWGLGSGLNTYRFVCPPFENRLTGDRWHYYAENQYLQALIDGGVVALVLLLITIGLVLFAIAHLYRRGGRSDTVIATMGTFALSSQVVGAAFDFGLFLPANAMLLAAICGAVVGRAVLPEEEGRANFLLGTAVQRDTLVIVSLPLLIAAVFGGIELHRAAAVEAIVAPAVRGEFAEERSDEVLAAWINQANSAIALRADDANGHRALTDLWMQRYRLAMYRSLRQREPWRPEEDSWQAASLFNLHNTLRELAPDDRDGLVRQLRGDEGAQSLLTPAWQHAVRARAACPWLPQTYLMLASLAPFVGDEPDSTIHLDKARQFAGGDPKLWYQIGVLEMAAGRTEAALDSWQHSLALSPQFEALILAEVWGTVPVETVLEQILPNEPEAQLRLVNRLSKTRADDARKVAEMVLVRLDARPDSASNDSSSEQRANGRRIRATLLMTLERYEEAITEWQRALEFEPDRTDWRTALAQSLLAAGRRTDAYQEVVRCLRVEPESRALKKLLEQTKGKSR